MLPQETRSNFCDWLALCFFFAGKKMCICIYKEIRRIRPDYRNNALKLSFHIEMEQWWDFMQNKFSHIMHFCFCLTAHVYCRYPNSWENVILKGQFLLGMEKSFHIWGFPIPTSLNLLGNEVENRSEIFNGVGNRLGKTLGSDRVWCYSGPNRMTKIDTQTWAKPGFCMCRPGSSPACPRFGLIQASILSP